MDGQISTANESLDNAKEVIEFLQDAQKHDGGESQKENYPLPSWVNLELIKEGQEFVRRNFFPVFFAHFISLVFLLCYEPVRIVLMKTFRSDSKTKALKRYLSTLIHVKRWYEGNLLEHYEYAAQDVYRVRRIHAGVSKQLKYKRGSKRLDQVIVDEDRKIIQAIQEDMRNSYSEINENNEDYLINEEERSHCVITQLDMVVTQFCFMGFILLYPTKFGIFANCNNIETVDEKEIKGLKGFVHLWAIIGHLLGVEDRFNLCLDRNANIRQSILHKVLLVDLKKCHTDSVKLWKSLASGISEIIPCISLRAVLLFSLRNLLECSTSVHVNSILSFYERFCYRMMDLCFNQWMKLDLGRIIANALLRLAIFLSERHYFPNKEYIPVIFHI